MQGCLDLDVPLLESVGYLSLRDGALPDMPRLGSAGYLSIDLEPLEGAGSAALELPRLETVTGSFNLSSGTHCFPFTGVDCTASFPDLERVRSLSVSGSGVLRELALPVLEEVERSLLFSDFAILDLQLSQLERVGGRFGLSCRWVLTPDWDFPPTWYLEFPQLSSIGAGASEEGAVRGDEASSGLFMENCEGSDLAAVSFPALTELEGPVRISELGRATTLELPLLSEVVGSVQIERSHGLELIDIGSLEQVYGDLEISNNDALLSLQASSLSRVLGNLEIRDNACYPESSALALWEQVEDRDGVSGTVSISGNGPCGG